MSLVLSNHILLGVLKCTRIRATSMLVHTLVTLPEYRSLPPGPLGSEMSSLRQIMFNGHASTTAKQTQQQPQDPLSRAAAVIVWGVGSCDL